MKNTEHPEKVSVTREDLLEFAAQNIDFYGLNMERVSSVLIAQLYQMQQSGTISMHSVTDELKSLEKIGPATRTKKEAKFKESTILREFFYTHFFDARFMMQNFAAEFGYNNGGNKKLTHTIGRVFHEHDGEYADEKLFLKAAHMTTVDAYQKRSARGALTGEWIIIAKHKGERYYLCLASHNESNEVIFERVRDACELDFHFISVGA